MTSPKVYGMVLAAGLGTRLRPLTDRIPKPVVEVAGKPLIFYALENMRQAGVTRVVINTHYLHEQVEKKVLSASWPFEIIFLHEREILGTGGGILNAANSLRGADAIVLQNADAIIEQDVGRLVQKHLTSHALSTMLLKTVPNPEAYGVVLTDQEDRVRDIIGKVGYQGSVHKRRMFCGMQVLSWQIMNWMPKRSEFCILRDVLIPAIKAGSFVDSDENTGFFCDVGTLERLEFANAHFTKSDREKTSLYSA